MQFRFLHIARAKKRPGAPWPMAMDGEAKRLNSRMLKVYIIQIMMVKIFL
jgi:hypothetical protein